MDKREFSKLVNTGGLNSYRIEEISEFGDYIITILYTARKKPKLGIIKNA